MTFRGSDVPKRVSAGLLLAALGSVPGGAGEVSAIQDRVAALGPEAVTITAHIRDLATGTGLPGAVIDLSGVVNRHVTDDNGRVSFQAEPGSYVLTVRRGGYETVEGDLRVIRPGDFHLAMRPETSIAREARELDAPARVSVRAMDAVRGAPVEGATVTLRGGRTGAAADASALMRAVTNRDGRAEFRGLDSDFAHVTVEMIGYATRTEPVALHADRTTAVEVSLTVEAVELAPIRVEVRSRYLEENGFYRRLDQGVVMRLLTRESILDRGSVRISDSFARVPGLQVDRTGPYRAELRARACRLAVFVDGLEWSSDVEGSVNIDQIPPEWVEVAEVYWGPRTPRRFHGKDNGGCGAVVIWTRTAARRG